MGRTFARFALASSFMVLASCGGDDSASTLPPQPDINSPPQITSPANVDLAEDRLEVNVTATDADGDALTFEVVGGADALGFSFIRDVLVLEFNADFELPFDADGDNVYEVVIAVSDGEATVQKALRIRIVNSQEGFELRRVRDGLGTVAAASMVDGSRLWVIRTDGSIWEERFNAPSKSTTIGRISGLDGPTDSEVLSFGTIAAPTGDLNTLVLSRHGGQARLTEYTPAHIAGGLPGTLRWSLDFANPASVSANLFAYQGQMMLAIGDNGNPDSAQDDATQFGGLFRIVGSANAGLTLDREGRGLRDPRLGFMTGDGIRVIDRGVLQDEVNELPRGDNFEWPLRDGRLDGPVASVPAVLGTLSPPTFVWPSDERGKFVDYVEGVNYCTLDGISIVVGTSDGRFFSGNSQYGRFEERTQDFIPVEGQIDGIIAVDLYDDFYWGLTRVTVVDRDGEIYLLDQYIPCDKF